MEQETLIEQLKQKNDVELYVELARRDETVLPMLFDILEHDRRAIKYLCEKILRRISETDPRALLPYFDRMAGLLESDNSFIQWGFLLSLPNLLPVDEEERWRRLLPRFLLFLDSDSVAAFGNAAAGVARILERYPECEPQILDKLLAVQTRIFVHKGEPSPACRDVAAGHVLACFEQIYDRSQHREKMLAFARANLDNPRAQVRSRAKRLIREHGEALC